MKHHRPIPAYVLAALVTIGPLVSVSAHEYDRNDSDHPLRVVSYVLHPIGVFFEHTITRPAHWIAHQPGVGYFIGHQVPGVRQTEEEARPGDFPIPAPFMEPEAELVTPPALAPAAELDEPLDPFEDEKLTAIDTIDLNEQSIIDGSLDLQELTDEPEEKSVTINVTDEGVHFTIAGEAVLFNSGSADLSPAGKELLESVAAQIAETYPDRELVVQGHTDNEPIKHSAWDSNWELGAARALTLVHYLVDDAGFESDKVAALTYGAHRAAAPNDTPEQKAKNRRAIITVRSNGA